MKANARIRISKSITMGQHLAFDEIGERIQEHGSLLACVLM